MRENRSPKELFKQPRIQERYLRFMGSRLTLGTALENLEIIKEGEVLDALEHLRSNSSLNLEAITSALRSIPAQEIVDNYGLDVLAWIVVNSRGGEVCDNHLMPVLEGNGYDRNIFYRTMHQSHLAKTPGEFKAYLEHYKKINGIMNGGIQSIDLRKFLSQTTEQSFSEQRLEKYSATPMMISGFKADGYADNWKSRRAGNLYYRIWLDAPFGLALSYNNMPAAVMAFEVQDNDCLFVKQLQGVRPWKIINDGSNSMFNETFGKRAPTKGLHMLEWRELLIGMAVKLAEDFNIPRVGVQSAEKNKWIKQDPGVKFDLERAKKGYDDVAKRLFFRRSRDLNWYLRITR